MTLKDILQANQQSILKCWRASILDAYPPDKLGFLRKNRNPFANPIGHAVSRGTATLLDELLGKADTDRVEAALDGIMRISAVQSFAAAEAVGGIAALKDAVRTVCGKELERHGAEAELAEFDAAVDRLWTQAQDVYARCREQLRDLRASELRRLTHMPRRMAAAKASPAR